MKLVVTHYLRSLRERDELDAILPDLLSETGFEVLTRPQRGTRQAGVDVAAVGPDTDRDGRRTLFLFTVKSGDLTRAHWDGAQQAVRPSVNEILDDYIPNRIPPQYADLPIAICVCMGGEMREDIRAQWSGFCKTVEKPNLRLCEWNGERLADLILSGMLRAELVDGEHRGLFQKALAMLDQPDVAYRHFSHLLEKLFTATSDERIRTRQLRQAYLCLWILFVWARDGDNLDSAYRGAELLLLRSWPHCDRTRVESEALKRERMTHFEQVLKLYLIVAHMLLVEKIGPFANRRFALSMTVGSRNSKDVNLALFETLGRFALYGIWLHQLSTMNGGSFAEATDREANRVFDLAIETVNANPTLIVPVCDEFAIEITLFVYLAHLRGRLRDVSGYLSAMAEHLWLALMMRDGYPTPSTDYRVILEHPRNRTDEYFEEHTRASILYPVLLTWLTLLGDHDRRDRLVAALRERAPHMTNQAWVPDSLTDEVLWHGNRNHDLAVPGLPIEYSMGKVFEVFNEVTNKHPIAEHISAVRIGLTPLMFTACRHFRMPVPLHLWHAGFDKPSDSENNSKIDGSRREEHPTGLHEGSVEK